MNLNDVLDKHMEFQLEVLDIVKGINKRLELVESDKDWLQTQVDQL
jgi:hypothetical protein